MTGPELERRSEENRQTLLNIGAALRTARKARGLSLREAAIETGWREPRPGVVQVDRVGLSPVAIGSYERGDRGVSVLALLRLAAGYGADPRDLLPTGAPPDPYAALHVLRAFVDQATGRTSDPDEAVDQ